jgi:lipase chaperone LimK
VTRPVNRRRVAIGGVSAGALVAALVALRSADAPSRSPAASAARSVGSGAAALVRASEAVARAPEPAPPAALPASLEGTEPDGAVAADAAGRLIIDIELRRLFDHFLAASGEEPLATIRARIVAVLRARLPATATGEAIAILDRYLGYRDAARALVPPADPAAGLDQVHDLRVKMFSPAVVRAFFADEEAATAAALARSAVLQDGALSAAERERRLAEIEARAPAAVREARAAALVPLEALNRETQLRAAGASDAQIAAARTAALGPEAAARLAELDRARAAWDARLAEFRAARAAVLADPELDDAERQRRIDELLARSFSPPERLRVDTVDRLEYLRHAGSAR